MKDPKPKAVPALDGEVSGKKEKKSPDYASWARLLLHAERQDTRLALGSEAKRDCVACKPSCAESGSGAEGGFGLSAHLEEGTLYVVATPIGNLGDMTLRALATLAGVDLVACEDTRVTGALLHRFGIKKTLIACHDHNERDRAGAFLEALRAGKTIALVSDAGTPLISDPGYKIVAACRSAGFPVVPVPGASAVLSALSAGGLPTDRFLFVGFLPPKQTARRQALDGLKNMAATLVFYESAPRLNALLEDLADIFGPQRQAVVARELTKLYEAFVPGDLVSLAAQYRDAAPKGEIVVLVAPSEQKGDVFEDAEISALLTRELKTKSVRDAATVVAEKTGLRRKDLYARALLLAAEKES